MSRLLTFALLALVLVPATASARADGCPPSSCGAQSVSFSGSRLLYVRPSGAIGPLSAYDLATGKLKFALGRGLLSADGTRFYTARDALTHTTIARYGTTSGRLLGAWATPGHWWLGGISANGRWIVLAASKPGRGMTRLAVASNDRHRIVRTLPLHGWWEIETVSNDGRRLFLIQHLRTAYVVRVYDVARGALRPGSVRIKNESPQMVGSAWGSIGSPDGSWLLTLYIGSGSSAFVHALDLRLAVARCLDLPTAAGADFGALSQYVFVLSRDGKSLFAANPALGVVAQLDLASGRVVQTIRFHAPPATDSPAAAAVGAMSHDGRTLYFSTGGAIWAFDAAAARVRGPYYAGEVVGMGFSPDDRRLYVVRSKAAVVALDAARGTTLRR